VLTDRNDRREKKEWPKMVAIEGMRGFGGRRKCSRSNFQTPNKKYKRSFENDYSVEKSSEEGIEDG
jgi:hypothetical protein